MFDLDAYLASAFAGFIDDPADTDYQRGYLAGLKAVAEAAGLDLGRANEAERATVRAHPVGWRGMCATGEELC